MLRYYVVKSAGYPYKFGTFAPSKSLVKLEKIDIFWYNKRSKK